MAKVWLEIQRTTGIDRRAIKVTDGASAGVAAGSCPACGVSPFLVAGGGKVRLDDDRTYRANGRSVCCNEAVGYIYAATDTLFGLSEDERVLGGLARVY